MGISGNELNGINEIITGVRKEIAQSFTFSHIPSFIFRVLFLPVDDMEFLNAERRSLHPAWAVWCLREL